MLPAADTHLRWNWLMLTVVVFLYGSAFFIPAGRTDDWIPLVSGAWDADVLYESLGWRVGLGAFFMLALVLPVYILNYKAISHAFDWNLTALFLGALVFSNPSAVYFSGVYPAAVCLYWSQYCFFEKQKFAAFLLLSAGALCHAPLVWLIPCMLLPAVAGSPDPLRDLARCVGGAAVPFLYLFSFRYLAYDDLDYFLLQYRSAILDLGKSVRVPEMTALFLMICVVFVFVRAGIAILRRLSRYSPQTAEMLRVEMITALLLMVLMVLFARPGAAPLNVLPAPALALAFSHYFHARLGKNTARIELVLLLCALIIARAAYFVN